MLRTGDFAFKTHDPSRFFQHVREWQPSLVVVWASVTSVEELRDWRAASPNTIFLLIDGDIGDSNTKEHIDDPHGLAVAHVDQFARWRDRGYGGLWMLYNEPPVWNGRDYRLRLTEYTAWALDEGHARGLNECIWNFSVSWPFASIDDAVEMQQYRSVVDNEGWWNDLGAAVGHMDAGDYVGLHEYWGRKGPLDLGAYPWLTGKHKLCPFNVPMLIGEYGIDLAVDGEAHRGWQAAGLSSWQYHEQTRQYHATLDPRVKGTARFVWDFASHTWETFDVRPLTYDGCDRGEWDMGALMVAPSRLRLPFLGTHPVTQWYGENAEYYRQFGCDGHNGIDWSMVVGTPLVAVAAGRVTRSRKDANGYGWHVMVNYGFGQDVHAHMSRIDVAEQQDVTEGQVIGLSGNTGNSTGPHLHWGLRIYGQSVPAMNDWVDAAGILGLQEDDVITEAEKARARQEAERLPFMLKAAASKGVDWGGFEYVIGAYTYCLGLKIGTEEQWVVKHPTGAWDDVHFTKTEAEPYN